MKSAIGMGRRLVGRLTLVCGSLLILGAACIGGTKQPTKSAHGALGLGSERGPRVGAASAFRVVYAAPEGEASEISELSVVFSRPLIKLDLAGAAPIPPIVMEPPLKGRWLWVGTHALRFVPETPHLSGATHYKITIPGELKALDGSALGAPYAFEFTTPRPKFIDSDPVVESRGLLPSARFTLHFNQPIDPAELERHAVLSAEHEGKSEKLAFHAVRPDPGQTKRVRIDPLKPLPIHASLKLTLSAELRGQEGPLPLSEPQELAYETYGPLEVTINCSRSRESEKCPAGQAWYVEPSNPVSIKELKRAITITPAVPLKFSDYGEQDGEVSYLNLSARFQAGKTYTVRVASGLRDKYGQTLAQAAQQTLTVDDYEPMIEVGVSGSNLDPRQNAVIPVGAVNVGGYELVTAALTPADALMFSDHRGRVDDYERLARLPNARSRHVTPRAPLNHVATENLPASALLGASGRGPLAIGVHYDAGSRRSPTSIFNIVKVSDLALTAKMSLAGSLVWVTRVSTGEPVSGAEVELLAPGGSHKYRTDAHGLTRIPAGDFAPNFTSYEQDDGILIARSGQDMNYEEVANIVSPWRMSVPINLVGEGKDFGMLFTDRGVYRPGDEVQVKGIVRREAAGGNAVPVDALYKLTLRSPEGEEVATSDAKVSRFGTFATRFKIPETGHLGGWQLSVTDSNQSVADDFVEVAEYRPAEFKVGVESAQPSYVRGDSASWTAHGDYLFGAPMAKSGVRYTVSRSPTFFEVPESSGFVTDSAVFTADLEQSALNAGQLLAAEAKLDAHGAVVFEHKLELPGQRGAELLTAEASVTDLSRQSLSGSTSLVVHPAQFYLGIKQLDDFFVNAPGKLAPQIVALSPSGQRLAGKAVKLELVQRRWTYARAEQADGSAQMVSKVVDRVLSSCTLTTAAEAVSCPLDVTQAGYLIVHATSKDARGNLAEAALGEYALGASGGGFRDSDQLKLDLVTNKRKYKIGDTARVLVKSPFPDADALVTVERAGIYRTTHVKLHGPTPTVEVPISDDLRPNAFVGVHLVRARAVGEKQSLGAPYRLGYAELSIEPESRRLAITVKPNKRDFLPGEEASVELELKDNLGKPASAELTIYAVDEGVLSLTGYKTPDPVPVFTAARPLGVATLESRESLARIGLESLGAMLGADKGADGGGGGMAPARRDFKQTAYFNPSVLSDVNGKAVVRFKLPDTLTTYRVMAVAANDGDRYGFGATQVTVSRKLMARPALPRFLRAGDSLEAGVVVSSKNFGPGEVTVQARLEGITLQGEALKRVQLERDQSTEVRFAMRAERAGTAKLRFDVSAGGERDAVEVERKIASPAVMEAVALYGKVDESSREQLGDLSAIRPDLGSFDVTLSSSALVGLDTGVDQLVKYPYGCTEQLSSRLMPLVPLRALAKDFKIALPLDLDKVIPTTVAEIVSRQHGDGGFGLWPTSNDSYPWVTAYALFTLGQVKKYGVSVPQPVLDRGKDYLRAYLNKHGSDPYFAPTMAYVLDVLAELGAPDFGYMQQCYDRRKELPLFAKALLVHALAVSRGSKQLIAGLTPELENTLRIDNDAAYASENLGDEYAVLMDSTLRTSALVLRALLSVKPDHALGAQLARGLLAKRENGTWRSTQETTYALLALDEYRKAQEKVIPDFDVKVLLGQTTIADAKMHGRSVGVERAHVDVAKMGELSGASLLFDKRGAGSLFYEARLRYARKTLPAEPLDQGFFVQKMLRSVSAEQLPDALRSIGDDPSKRFKGGELVLTDLVIVSPSPRDYVVVDDPLPAGFEAVDSTLATTSSALDVGESEYRPCMYCGGDDEERDRIASGKAYFEDYSYRELRDDRVLYFSDHMVAGMYHFRYLARATSLGQFVLPPTRVEEMYGPETFGRTGALMVKVE